MFMQNARKMLFLSLTLVENRDFKNKVPDDFVNQLAKKLALKAYSLFWSGSTANGLPTDMLIGTTTLLTLNQMFNDFREAVAELYCVEYELGPHYLSANPV